MATSGITIVTVTNYITLQFSWSVTSQSVENNTSTVDWNLKLHSTSPVSVSGVGNKKWTVTVNGTSYTGIHSIDMSGDMYVTTASGTTVVAHDDDGSKTFSLSFSQVIGVTFSYSGYVGTISGSGTGTLNTIARASSFSSDSSIEMGSAGTVTITAASTAFTHTLTYAFGNATGTIVEKTSSTTVSWTPDLTLANQIPSSVSGLGTITCATYNGDTLIGSKSCNVTLTIPDTVIPIIGSLTVSRVDGDVPSSWGIYIQGKSKAKLTINSPAGVYGSSISSYRIVGGNYSGTASTLTTGYLNIAGTITFTATVTDSRGRTSNVASVSIAVIAYSIPAVSKEQTFRSDSTGEAKDDGTYATGNLTFTYASCSGKNTLTYGIYAKKTTDTDWTSYGTAFSSGVNVIFGNGAFATDYTYDIKYTITDAFNTITITDRISTAAVVMDFKAGGKGVSVGKVSENDEMFEVTQDWDVKVYGMLLAAFIKKNIMAYGTCATEATTKAKVVVCDGFELAVGEMIVVKFTYATSIASPTMNVNEKPNPPAMLGRIE